MHACIHEECTYFNKCIHTFINIYTHTYIHTYIHTYLPNTYLPNTYLPNTYLPNTYLPNTYIPCYSGERPSQLRFAGQSCDECDPRHCERAIHMLRLQVGSKQYIHIYIHTFIHTYIHTCVYGISKFHFGRAHFLAAYDGCYFDRCLIKESSYRELQVRVFYCINLCVTVMFNCFSFTIQMRSYGCFIFTILLP